MSERLAGTPLKYRPDVDGLRAVAVLSVLGFHAGLGRLSGGYVGVDVFFVISGYLISSIVFNEISGSRFSIIDFYERRIRRIFPALFAVLIVCSVFAVSYLLPSELVSYCKSMLAATTSTSNFYFWKHSGYFDAPTSQPLLHTWSLAVEEQFYIAFPLFLVFVRKLFPNSLRTSVVLVFFCSLVASIVVVSRNADTAFYMPYTRAWELLLGTILSLRIFPPLQTTWLRNLVTLVGIGLIAFAVLSYSQATLFPGVSALAPCVGSALVIWGGEAGGSLVGSLLSWRPVVFIGLISYSLYLWHWPVIILRNMGVIPGLGAISSQHRIAFLSSHQFDVLIEIAISFVLAVVSWALVERPFRGGPLRLSGRPLFAAAGLVVLVSVAFCSLTVKAGGFSSRFPPNAIQVASDLDGTREAKLMRTGSCFITTDFHFEKYNYDTCLRQENGKKNYLLVGDSHSAMLWDALSSSLQDANVMQASTADCKPSLHPQGSADCRKMMDYIFKDYLPTHPVQGLFVAGRWDEKDMQGLTELIAWAHQHQVPVTVFGPVPEYDGPLPRLLAYSLSSNDANLASKHLVAGLSSLDAEMQSLAANNWHVRYVSLYREICDAQSCAEYADDSHTLPLMGDTNHLTQAGASLVIKRLVAKGELD